MFSILSLPGVFIPTEIIFIILIVMITVFVRTKIVLFRDKSLTERNHGLIVELLELKKQKKILQENCDNYLNEIKNIKADILSKDEIYDNIIKSDNPSIKKISSLYSDYLTLQYNISAKYLEEKKHPAIKEASRIKDLQNETKYHLQQFREMLYKYEMLLNLFPELINYVDDFDTIKQLENINSLKDLQEDFDRVRLFVSKDEYEKLSTDERNQLALDRYLRSRKSKWQIGRDYELYCGIQYERYGWNVEYYGMERKLSDLGRDLIARKGNTHYVVQCKYWSHKKIIREKHITQIFGTAVEYEMHQEKNISVSPVLITNTNISETAKKFAEKLKVRIRSNYHLKEFPRIKCNINRDQYGRETYIYHLPFDQQYDRTQICKNGEFYAFTVNEAVNAGFRRAFRYFGA